MATFSYGGVARAFPGNSGVFLNATTSTDGTGTQSHPLLLVYRGQKKVKYYRDASTVAFMGRGKPATETGQYNFRTVDLQYSWPPTGTDYAGSAVTNAQMEDMVTNLVNDLQAGKFLELQDAKGRHLYGTLTQDPEITDETGSSGGPGWQTISCSFVEVGS